MPTTNSTATQPPTTQDHPVWNSIRAIGHGIGWLIPGVQEAQAIEASTNAHRQEALRNKIDEYRTRELANPQPDDPNWHQRVNTLNQLSQEVQQMGPFDNPSKHAQRLFNEYESLHPAAYNAPTRQPQVTATPGPAQQGQPMGQPNISISGIDQSPNIPPMPSLVGSGMPAAGSIPFPPHTAGTAAPQNPLAAVPQNPLAAVPPTSPASAQAQGGAAPAGASPFPILPEPPSTTGVGSAGDQGSTPTFQVGATGLSPTPPDLVMPPRPSYMLPPPSLEHNTYQQLATAMNESQKPYVQAQADVEQALNTLRGNTEFQMAEGPRRLQILRGMVGEDTWNKIPDPIKAEIAATAMQMPLPGIGQMMTLRLLTPDATGAELQARYPGPETDNLDKQSHFRAEWSPLQGLVISPHALAPLPINLASGERGVASREHPEQAPTAIPGSTGQFNFDNYLQTSLKAHGWNLTPYTARVALAEWTAAGQKPPQDMVLSPGPSGTWTAQRVQPGATVSPNAIKVAGLNTENVPTAQVRTQAQLATALVPEAESIKQTVQQLSDAIGPAMGRGYKFDVNTIGRDFPQFAGLDTKLDAYATAFMRAHGYRSQEMHDALLKQLTASQSPANLIARIDGLEDFLKGYIGAGQIKRPPESSGPGAPITVPQTPSKATMTLSPAGQAFLQKYGVTK